MTMKNPEGTTESRAFAVRLKQALAVSDAADWSQSELARELGISSQQVNNYFMGKRMPSITVAESLCQLTGVSFEWLLTGSNPKGHRTLDQIWALSSPEERQSLLAKLISHSETK